MPRWFVCYSCGSRITVHESATAALCPQCGQENTVPPDALDVDAPPPQQAPTKQSWRGTIIATVAVLGIVAGLVAWSALGGGGTPSDSDPAVPPPGGAGTLHGVRYTVSGPSQANSITYQNENADSSQDNATALPWTYSFSTEEGAFLYVSAQKNAGAGTITCEISVDGVTVESNEARGPFAICTASGNL